MIYLFDNQERLIHIIRRQAIQSVTQTQTLTDTRYVSDRLTAEVAELSDDVLEQAEYVALPVKGDKTRFHLFFLARHESDNGLTTLEGVQSGVEELRKRVIKDQRPKDMQARPVIERLLEGSNWQARYVAEGVRGSTSFYYDSVFDSLLKVCEVWDLEMQFFVEIANNHIGARYIDFKRKVGKKVGARVVYGHNALKILKESEKTDLVTAAIGRGKGEEVSSAEEHESGKAGYGRKITFADVVWSKAKGDPVDKPAGQEYVEIPSATARYGTKMASSMVPKVGIVEFDTEDRGELLRRTYEWILENSHPKVTFKTTTAYLTNAEIGDTVRVVKSRKNLDYETRIFEITWDRLAERSTDVKLGDRLNVSEGRKAAQLANSIADSVGASVAEQVLSQLPSADGFHSTWSQAEEPPRDKTKVGDTWYKPDPEHEGYTIMYSWDGEHWIEIVRTYESSLVNQELTTLKEQSQAHNQAIAAADQKAREAIQKAGGVELTASEAKRLAEAAQRNLDSAKISLAADIRSLDEKLTSAKFDLSGAKRELEGQLASSRKDLSNLRTQLDTTKRDVLAQADAQRDLTSRVTTVETTANSTKTSVSELTKKVDATSGKVTEVEKKAKTVEDGLSGLRTQLSTVQIDGQAIRQSLATYEQSTNRALSEIQQNAQTADGKISRLSSKIEQTAQGFETRMSAVESYKNGEEGRKQALHDYVNRQTVSMSQTIRTTMEQGYATKQSVTETAEAFTRRFESLKVGGRNLLLKTSFETLDAVHAGNRPILTLIPNDYNGHNSIEVKVTDAATNRWAGILINASQDKFKAGDTLAIRLPIYLFSDVPFTGNCALELKTHQGNRIHYFKHLKDLEKDKWHILELTHTLAVDLDFQNKNFFYIYVQKNGHFKIAEPMLTVGTLVPQTWIPAPEDGEATFSEFKQDVNGRLANMVTTADFQRVKETANLYERVIGATDTDIAKKVTQMVMTNQSWTVKVKELEDKANAAKSEASASKGISETVQSMVNNSWAVRQLNKAGDIIGQLNLTNGVLKFDGKLFHITSNTLIDKGVIAQAYIKDLKADEATIRQLTAAIAKFTTVDAKNVTAGEFDGFTFKGGKVLARNGAMKIDLDGGVQEFYTDQAAIRRKLAGYPSQFVKFTTQNDGGRKNGITAIGSSRTGSESLDDGGFVGLIATNGETLDDAQLVADRVLFSGGRREKNGIYINSYPAVEVVPKRAFGARIGSQELPFTEVWSDFYYLRGRGGKVFDLRKVLWYLFNNADHIAGALGNAALTRSLNNNRKALEGCIVDPR